MEGIVLTNVLMDIYHSNINQLPNKYCILDTLVEEILQIFRKDDGLSLAEGQTKDKYATRLSIFQLFFSKDDEASKGIRNRIIWFMDNIKSKEFVDTMWSAVEDRGSIIKAVNTLNKNNS